MVKSIDSLTKMQRVDLLAEILQQYYRGDPVQVVCPACGTLIQVESLDNNYKYLNIHCGSDNCYRSNFRAF